MAHKLGFSAVNTQFNRNKEDNSKIEEQLSLLQNNLIFGRVTDIILDDTYPNFQELGGWSIIGTIFFEPIEPNPRNTKETTLQAAPLLPYLKNYPVVDELVVLLYLPNKQISDNANIKQYYYLNPISVWNNQHLNAYPDLNNISTTQPTEQKDYQAIEQGQTRKSSNEEINYDYNSPLVGGTFIERSNIHPLLAYAGDIILEGRWGNSIRFGSTANTGNALYNNNWSNSGEDGNPITIIRNGQPSDASEKGYLPLVEDINKDLSSIYLTSNQTIPLTTTITNNPSIKDNPPESIGSYDESQVMISSNRLVFNANSTGSLLLNSEGSISLTSINGIGLYSQDSDIVLQSGKNNIRLGDSNASQSLVLGDAFMTDFRNLLTKLQALCQTLSIEPKLFLSGGPASSLKSQTTSMLNSINDYKSKIVKTI